MAYDVALGYDTDWQTASPNSFTYHLGNARGDRTLALTNYQAANANGGQQMSNQQTGLLSGWTPGKTPEELGLSAADAAAFYKHGEDLRIAMGYGPTPEGYPYQDAAPATQSTGGTSAGSSGSASNNASGADWNAGRGQGLLTGFPAAGASPGSSSNTSAPATGGASGTAPAGNPLLAGFAGYDAQGNYIGTDNSGASGTGSGTGSGAGTGTGTSNQNGGGLLTTPVTPTPATATGLQQANAQSAQVVNVAVDPSKTSQGLYETYSARDTVAKQLAETRAKQQAESVGLLNSSIAVGAVQAARDAVDMATAQTDAGIHANAAQTNAQLGTNVNLSNAAANNAMSQFNANWANDLAKLDQQFKNSIALAAVDEATQMRLMQAQQTFQASQTALDRELTRWQHTTPSASQADSAVQGTMQRLAALPGDVANQLANIAAVDGMSDGAKAAAMNQIINAAIGQQNIMLSQLSMYNFTPSVNFDFNTLRPGAGATFSGSSSNGSGGVGNNVNTNENDRA